MCSQLPRLVAFQCSRQLLVLVKFWVPEKNTHIKRPFFEKVTWNPNNWWRFWNLWPLKFLFFFPWREWTAWLVTCLDLGMVSCWIPIGDTKDSASTKNPRQFIRRKHAEEYMQYYPRYCKTVQIFHIHLIVSIYNLYVYIFVYMYIYIYNII